MLHLLILLISIPYFSFAHKTWLSMLNNQYLNKKMILRNELLKPIVLSTKGSSLIHKSKWFQLKINELIINYFILIEEYDKDAIEIMLGLLI